MDGGAIAGRRLLDHPSAEGSSHLAGAIARAVVDDHDVEVLRETWQQGLECGRLVATRQHEGAKRGCVRHAHHGRH